MIRYYLGNVRAKRRLFVKPRAGAVVADNCDVTADFPLGGKICFLLGSIPYADMRVGEYLSYARSLKTRLPLPDTAAKALLKRVGLRVSVRRKMGRLSRMDFRAVMLAAKLDDDITEAWLEMDGIAYSARAKWHSLRLLKAIERNFAVVHVSFSDYRFVPKKAETYVVTAEGVHKGFVRSASRRLSGRHVSGFARAYGFPLVLLKRGKALVCDN